MTTFDIIQAIFLALVFYDAFRFLVAFAAAVTAEATGQDTSK